MENKIIDFKTKDWIRKAINKHGDLWNYSKSIYINAKTKLIITCKIHGEFLQCPNNHLQGSGCPDCGKILNSLNRTKSLGYFISEAIKVHGNLYSYVKSVYTGVANKLIIICKIHGDFEQTAGNHLMGRGCQKCSQETRKSNESEFIEKSNPIHNWFYNYDKFIYSGAENKGIITCPKHGDFEQTPASHLSGSGCPDCGILKRAETQTLTFEEFLIRAEKTHPNSGNIYLDYNGYKNMLNIICPTHGKFSQLACNYLSGSGCQECGKISSILNRTKSENQLIMEANEKHDNKYSYPNPNYTGAIELINIYCSEKYADGTEHGEFQQIACNHINQGKGCPKCARVGNSKAEQEIVKFLESLGIENIIKSDRKILNGKELDIYLPDYKLAIEYNGLFFHSDDMKTDNYHLEKTNDCIKHDIQLIHIFEDEFIYKKEIVYSRLRNLLGKSLTKIYARKTKIGILTSKIANEFYLNNHIQGETKGETHIGLYYGDGIIDELISVMSFSLPRKVTGKINENNGTYELIRFCNKINTNVIGGASKLLKFYIKNFKPLNIYSYADKRWSKGNLYEKIGFELSHESKPSYFYIKKLKRLHRREFQKHILVSKYDCPKNVAARYFTKNVLGMNRIYDCGTYVYKLSISYP